MIRLNRIVNMAVAHIRRHADNSNIEILFHLTNPDLGINRVFNLQRNVGETIGSTLNRIKTNVEKEYNKKKKRSKNAKNGVGNSSDQVDQCTEVDLLIEKSDTTTWSDLLVNVDDHEFRTTKLTVFGQEYDIHYNHPYVSEFTMPTLALIGFECYPAKFKVEFTERDKCLFEWYRGLPTATKKDDDIVWSTVESYFDYT